MPRKPKVENSRIIKILEKHIPFFETNDFPEYSHEIWETISKELDRKWLPRTVYNHVREDKRGNLTAARRNKGIMTPSPLQAVLIDGSQFSDEEESAEETCNDSDWHREDKENSIPDGHEFHLRLSRDEWERIKPEENSNGTNTKLKKRVWINIIDRAFWLRHKLPCAFLGKWSNVPSHGNAAGQGYFLRFHAYCKSKKCNNQMIGTALKAPDDSGLELIVETRDTRGHYHEPVKRPLTANERTEAGREMKTQSAANYQGKLLRENVKFGEDVPHLVRELHVYRQAKMEENKKELGIGPKEKIDPIESIKNLAADPRFGNPILNLSSIPFSVSYCTQEQIHIYKEYCQIMKKASEIAIDATGRVVKKFETYPGQKTGHIFLYTIMINFEKTTSCVCAMLSEAHTQEQLQHWLKGWIRKGKLTSPGTCVSDYGRAILYGACMAFNNMDLKTYVDKCFEWALLDEAGRKKQKKPANTLILVDVAHVMAFVSKWECLTNKNTHPTVKVFFMRTVALLIDAQNIAEFERIFLLICTVALQPFEDTSLNTSKIKMTVLEARKELESYIAEPVKEDLATPETEEENEKDPVKLFEEGENNTRTHRWIKKLISMVKPASNEKTIGKMNGFFLPDFIVQLERIVKEFPLWTSAAIPPREKHASSAYQEAYYAYMRGTIFQHVRLPCQPATFISTHLQSSTSCSNSLAAQFKHFVHQNELPEASSIFSETQSILDDTTSGPAIPSKAPPGKVFNADDSDSKAYENWKGLAKKKVHLVDGSDGEISDDEELVGSSHSSKVGDVEGNSFEIPKTPKVPSEVPIPPQPEDASVTDESNPKFSGHEKSYFDVNENESCKEKGQESNEEGNSTIDLDEPVASSTWNDHSYCRVDGMKENVRADGMATEAEEEEEETRAKKPKIDKKDAPEALSTSIELSPKKKEPTLREFQTAMKIKRLNNAKGFTFKRCPEQKIMNNRKTSRRKGFFLMNGTRRRPERLGKLKVAAINTCGFDSIIHILQFAAIDDPTYFSFIKNSKNVTLKFLDNFITQGPINDIYEQRLNLLSRAYKIQERENSTRLNSFYLDAEDYINNSWSKFFASEPSALRTRQCSNHDCPPEQIQVNSLLVNHNYIGTHGFQALRQALQFNECCNVKCNKKKCGGTVLETTQLNSHIFIELDIKVNLTESLGKACALDQLPTTLHIGREYRLAGAIGYTPGHFTAYCLRITGSWLICNDMSEGIGVVTNASKTNIVPHAVIYIVQSEE